MPRKQHSNDTRALGYRSVLYIQWRVCICEVFGNNCTARRVGDTLSTVDIILTGGFDFIECFTTTFLRAHSWLNWVDEDDDEDEVGLNTDRREADPSSRVMIQTNILQKLLVNPHVGVIFVFYSSLR